MLILAREGLKSEDTNSGRESENGEGIPSLSNNVNQAPLPRLSKAPLVRASLVKRRYIKYLALPFYVRQLC